MIKDIKQILAERVIFYTTDCTICGSTGVLEPFIQEVKDKGLNPETRQTIIWQGWANEANRIAEKHEVGLPFAYFPQLNKALSIDNGNMKKFKELVKEAKDAVTADYNEL